MASLGLCGEHTTDIMTEMGIDAISAWRFEEEPIRDAYKDRYERMFWDTTCMEPRGRSGRHAAFIKHNVWFHMDKNPVLSLKMHMMSKYAG